MVIGGDVQNNEMHVRTGAPFPRLLASRSPVPREFRNSPTNGDFQLQRK